MLTEQTTIPALRMALKLRQPAQGLIFHSDGGGQYYCKKFLAITKTNLIKRINGTLKNDYLVCYAPQDYKQLVTLTDKAVKMYNIFRPHSSLGYISPATYELSTKSALVNNEKRSKKEILQQ